MASPWALVLTSLLLATPAVLSFSSKCPDLVPGDTYTKEFQNVCYRFVLYEKRDYPDAEKECEKLGGVLAVLKTKEIQEFVLSALKYSYHFTDYIWFGLSDADHEKNFFWEDGTPLKSTDFTNWAFANSPDTLLHPLHSFQDCVALNPENGRWYDTPCTTILSFWSYAKPYICQFNALDRP